MPSSDPAKQYKLSGLTGATRVTSDRPVQLARPTKVSEPPEGDNWIHEIKHDGIRLQAVFRDGVPRCISRQGNDLTATIPVIAAHLSQLGILNGQLDGELVAVNPDGREDFHLLLSLVRRRRPDRKAPLHYIAFDIMELEGWSLVGVPLLKRKELLQKVIHGSAIVLSTHHQGQGRELFAGAGAAGAEGMGSKRADSVYPMGTTRLWVKAIANPPRRRRGENGR